MQQTKYISSLRNKIIAEKKNKNKNEYNYKTNKN